MQTTKKENIIRLKVEKIIQPYKKKKKKNINNRIVPF